MTVCTPFRDALVGGPRELKTYGIDGMMRNVLHCTQFVQPYHCSLQSDHRVRSHFTVSTLLQLQPCARRVLWKAGRCLVIRQ